MNGWCCLLQNEFSEAGEGEVIGSFSCEIQFGRTYM